MNNNRNNNNNNNNNRRRGRSNRKPGQGGGSQGNRIDSRARGNAPQLLDKYKKLAQDAQHNGDRVQAEYYLQFADHYFRVIADNNVRRDEQRGPRRFDEGDEDGSEDENVEDRDERDAREPREPRRRDRDRERPSERNDAEGDADRNDGAQSDGDDARYESGGNPFLRRDRDAGQERDTGRERKPAQGGEEGRTRKPRTRKPVATDAPAGLDHSVLPPAIGRRAENDSDAGGEADAKPAPRRRRRKPEEDSAVAAE